MKNWSIEVCAIAMSVLGIGCTTICDRLEEAHDIHAVAQAAAQAELAAQVVSTRSWAEARKTLRISGTTTVTDAKGRKRHSVIINGLTYGDGDLISVNHEGHRFTWRVQGLTEGATLRLIRIRARDVDDDLKGDK